MNTIIMLLLISMLILVHELGHFVAARIFKVKVSKFGFGLPIGPTLFKKQIGDVEVLVHAFLLGGYVSFPDDDEKEAEEDAKAHGKEFTPDPNALPADSPLRFKNKKPYQKAIIIGAGVFMNLVFAVLITIFAAAFYQKLPTGTADIYIKEIVKKDNTSNIVNANIKPSDRVLSVNNIKINSANKFIYMVQNTKQFDGLIDGKTSLEMLAELKKLNPSLQGDKVAVGTTLKIPATKMEKPFEPTEAAASGYEKYVSHEIILSEKEVELRDKLSSEKSFTADKEYTLQELANALSDSYKSLNMTLQRGDRTIHVDNVFPGKNGLLGVKLESKEIFTETKNPKDIVKYSIKYLVDNTKIMVKGLAQLVTGKIPISEMHGILVITKVGSDIIEYQGLLNGLLLTAIISIDLAIINLLPIPALDGGHLMFILIEKITGRELDEKIVANIGRFFFTLLIILMVYVIFNDIFALATNKF